IALFILFSLAFVTTGVLSFVNLVAGLRQLFYVEIIFSLFSLFAMYRMFFKEVNFQRYALIFIVMLMIVLLAAVIKVPTTTRAVIFLFFFPFATSIVLEKRYAVILMSIFILLIAFIVFFNLSKAHFYTIESFTLIISLIFFSSFSAFYVYAVKEANKIIALKESTLLELQSRFKMVTDIAFEALIITKNAVIVQGNDKAVEMFGYQYQEDILDEHLQKFVTPQSMQQIALHVQNNDESAYVIDGIKKDGTVFPAKVRGKNVSYGGEAYRVSAIEDITNLQDAQGQITKFVSAIEQSSQMIFITNCRGEIEYVNGSFEKKTGFNSNEVIGKTPRVLKSNQHDSTFYNHLWEAITSGDAWSGEMYNRRKDGSIIIVQNFINSIKDKNGQITHFISTQEDVTEKKEHEKIVLSQMKQAQMGEMLSMIAHQWRQPLSTITTISGNIQLGFDLGDIKKEEIIDQLHAIDEHVFFLSDTVNDFRNFFEPDKKKHKILLSKLLSKVFLIIAKQLEMNNIKVEVINEEDPSIVTYVNEVVQVLLSLINNVIDKVSEEELTDQRIDIIVEKDEEMVSIAVQDYAGGIPEDIIDEIFIPYFSTKLEKHGTGLGLYMSKTIIEDHCAGTLSAVNQEGGARFIIKLPQSE
ncbi:MAG: PAS domain-containing sensor histidine kinase, partial [Thiovulaceae bacterium]|nr:PAS domain-containing sensor histidine kinase [Sulfurimonadaceae bacterium]